MIIQLNQFALHSHAVSVGQIATYWDIFLIYMRIIIHSNAHSVVSYSYDVRSLSVLSSDFAQNTIRVLENDSSACVKAGSFVESVLHFQMNKQNRRKQTEASFHRTNLQNFSANLKETDNAFYHEFNVSIISALPRFYLSLIDPFVKKFVPHSAYDSFVNKYKYCLP